MIRLMTLSIAALTLAWFPSLTDQAAHSREAAGRELPPYLQCVPFARELSGVEIYGDAHTWWQQAKGRYQRGRTPRVGAVMAFRPHRNMHLGHVAAVSRILDSRTVLLSHSNWSPINGRRGQIERDVKAVDVSPNNDWSQVRVWFHPIQALGKTAWPIHGFIYNQRGEGQAAPAPARWAQAEVAPVRPVPARKESSRAFLGAFSDFNRSAPAAAPVPTPRRPVARTTWSRPTPVAQRRASRGSDPLAAALAKYE